MENMKTLEVEKQTINSLITLLESAVYEALRRNMSYVPLKIEIISDRNRNFFERRFTATQAPWDKLIYVYKDIDEIKKSEIITLSTPEEFFCEEEKLAISKNEDYVVQSILVNQGYNWQIKEMLGKVHGVKDNSCKYRYKSHVFDMPKHVTEIETRNLINSLLAVDQKKLKQVVGKRIEEYEKFLDPSLSDTLSNAELA